MMIPEIEFKTYSFNLFNKEVYFYINSIDLELIKEFVKNIEKGISIDENIKIITHGKNISETNYIINRLNNYLGGFKKQIPKLQRLNKIKILKNVT